MRELDEGGELLAHISQADQHLARCHHACLITKGVVFYGGCQLMLIWCTLTDNEITRDVVG